MPFQPEDIARKQFLVRARGYDRDEVAAFLRAVAADYEQALEARAELETDAERRAVDLLEAASLRLEELAERERAVAEAEQRIAAQLRGIRELLQDARVNVQLAIPA